MLTFSVAVIEDRPDGTETARLRVRCWGEVAEQVAETLRRGDAVYCKGRLELATRQGPASRQRSVLHCWARVVQPLGALGKHPRKRRRAPLAAY